MSELFIEELTRLRSELSKALDALATSDTKLATARRELDESRRTVERLRAAVSQVVSWHSDPESPDYNGCDKEPCAWCEEALAALNTPAGDTGGKDAT